jgi:hypothetical protein
MLDTNRREFLRFAAFTAFRPPRWQNISSNAVTNAIGVQIAPVQGVPLLNVRLPGFDSPVAVIEMPEHAWRRQAQGDAPVWFYRMYTNDSSVKGVPQWTRTDNTLRYAMELPSGFSLSATAALDERGVQISYSVTNPLNTALNEVQAPTCIKLYRPFTDVFLERTFVHHPEGLDLLASESPERLKKNAEEWLPNRYIVRNSPQITAPLRQVERDSDGITRYRKLRAADAAFLATESQPSGWVASSYSDRALEVWSNPARTCHHTDAAIDLPARSTASMSQKFNIMRGRAVDAWMSVSVR